MKIAKHNLITASLLAFCSLSVPAFAANVPDGTALDAKQHLRWNNGTDPASFDPQKVEGAPEGNIIRNIFETLVTSNAQGKIQPGVAEKWTHSPDYKVWTFYLRPNAKWSNGDPVTAQDFVYSFRRLADPKTASPYSSYLDFLKLQNAQAVINGEKPLDALGVKALDAHTLQLDLSEPVTYIDKLVEHYVLAPVNQKIVEKYGDSWTDMKHIVTNGAFVPTEWIVNEKIELVPNKQYWDNAHTVLKKVTLYPITSDKTDVDRYRANGLDITASLPSGKTFKALKKQYPNEVYTPPTLCSYFYEFNTKRVPFNNPLVRKALSMALDRNIVTEKVIGQGQVPAYHFTPPYINNAEQITSPDWANWSQKARNAKAVELLKEAGFTKAHPLKVTLLYNTSESHKQIAIAATSMWKKNLQGAVQVKMENQEWKTYLDTRHNGGYEVARAGWCADYNEASTFLNYFLSNSTNNTSFYKSKAFDELMTKAYTAKNDSDRAKFYAQASAQLSKDAPIIPVYFYVGSRMVKPYVKGFAVNHPNTNYYLKDVYIIEH